MTATTILAAAVLPGATRAAALPRGADALAPCGAALALAAVACQDCGRMVPRLAATLYRRDGSWHCDDGAACAAATRARDGEAGR